MVSHSKRKLQGGGTKAKQKERPNEIDVNNQAATGHSRKTSMFLRAYDRRDRCQGSPAPPVARQAAMGRIRHKNFSTAE